MVPPLPTVTLAGRNVRLEPLSLVHVDGLLDAAREDRSTYNLTPVPDNLAAMRRYVESAISEQEAGVALAFATVDARSDRVVGTTRFFDVQRWEWPDGHPFARGGSEPDAVEIGYTWLASSAQRTAVNTEAKLLMLTHAFETWGVHRVQLKTDARNERSRRAIERLGATFEGELRSHLPAFDGAGVRTSAMYSIIRLEWAGVRAELQGRLR